MRFLRFIWGFLFILPLFAQEQREGIFGSASSPSTLDTLDAPTLISRVVTFKGPKEGSVTLYGKAHTLTGTDTAIVVLARMLGSIKDSPAQYSEYDTLGIIADGDSIFFYSVSRKSWWTYCDGLQIKFMADTTGEKTWQIRATLKIK